MTHRSIVRGGTVVEATWSGRADVYIDGERVAAVVAPYMAGPRGWENAEIIDATDRLVMPGGVDPHCHVAYASGPFVSLDDYRTCTTAALYGGTTTIVDFAIPQPGERPLEVARAQREKAAEGLCDSALHGSVVEWDDTTRDQLLTMLDEGIVTVKMFTTYRGETMADDDTILRTMQVLAEGGGMVVIHCEANHIIEEDQRRAVTRGEIDARHMASTRSELAETSAVAGVLATAEALGTAVYFVHQSTPAAMDLVAAARRRGVSAYTEGVVHHLVLDDSLYDGPEPERFVCCPPLRDRDTVADLERYLFNGQITTIASDHCCYDLAQKRSHTHDVREMPNGLPGVETRLPVFFSEFVASNKIGLSRFVALSATNPARVNGLYPRKGTLLPGSDADIAIWDPQASWTIEPGGLHMSTDYSPFEGRSITGRPETVLVRGHRMIEAGRLIDETARGRHIPAGAVDLAVF